MKTDNRGKNRRTQNKYSAFSENPKIYACDFETTTDIDNCYVWSACIVELGKEDVKIFSKIENFMYFILNLDEDSVLYFHNLKFDGTFILDFILRHTNYKSLTDEKRGRIPLYEMRKGQFQYLITDKGQWYEIVFRTSKCFIKIRDSLKLLPFSLAKLGKDFKVKHQKTTMDYDNKKSLADCSEKDIEYIKNDVLCLSECLQEFQKQYTLKSLTIGSACVNDFKEIYRDSIFQLTKFKDMFVECENYPIDEKKYNIKNFNSIDIEQFVRKTYKGAFCCVNPKYQNQELNYKGCVLDVNSLYPFVMYNPENKYPTGEPTIFEGSIYDNGLNLYDENRYFFIHIQVNGVKLKKGFLPTFQIKHDLRFRRNEWITEIDTSTDVDLYFTETDYKLFQQHYRYKKCVELGGVWFFTHNNLFKDYIDKHMKDKIENEGAKRAIAKLFLNNCYGKFASNRKTNYKIVKLIEDKLQYINIESDELKPSLSIPIGSAITAYARAYTISHAQQNIKYWVYSDTDSCHFICTPDKLTGFEIDKKKLGAWDLELEFDTAKYIRQKTYVEIADGELHLTACGMNSKCKEKVKAIINSEGLQAFNHNLIIEGGKLRPVLTKGGTVLVESPFTLR